jgi:hypothetical protein
LLQLWQADHPALEQPDQVGEQQVPFEHGSQEHAERLISDVSGNRHLGEEHRHPRCQRFCRAGVLRRVQHCTQVSTGLQHVLDGGITQEFRSAETIFGDHRGRIEGHPEHLASILTQGLGVERIPQRGGGAHADQVPGRDA